MSRSLTVRVGIIRSSVSKGQILEEKFIVLHRSGKKKEKRKKILLNGTFYHIVPYVGENKHKQPSIYI